MVLRFNLIWEGSPLNRRGSSSSTIFVSSNGLLSTTAEEVSVSSATSGPMQLVLTQDNKLRINYYHVVGLGDTSGGENNNTTGAGARLVQSQTFDNYSFSEDTYRYAVDVLISSSSLASSSNGTDVHLWVDGKHASGPLRSEEKWTVSFTGGYLGGGSFVQEAPFVQQNKMLNWTVNNFHVLDLDDRFDLSHPVVEGSNTTLSCPCFLLNITTTTTTSTTAPPSVTETPRSTLRQRRLVEM